MDSIPNNDEPVDYEIFFAAKAIQQSRLGFFIGAYYSQLDHLFSSVFFVIWSVAGQKPIGYGISYRTGISLSFAKDRQK
jgi:hypothetical protein